MNIPGNPITYIDNSSRSGALHDHGAQFFFSDSSTLSFLLAYTKEPFVLADKNGTVQLFNQAWVRRVQSGMQKEAATGMQLGQLVPSDYTEALQSELEKAAKGTAGQLLVNWSLDGSVLYEQLTFQPIAGDDDRTVAIMITGQDVTGSVQAQNLCEELDALINHTSEPFVVLGVDGMILRCNQPAVHLFEKAWGKKPEQGTLFATLNPVPEHRLLEQAIGEALRGEVQVLEWSWQPVGEPAVYYTVRVKPLYNSRQELAACIITAQNRTLQKLAEQKLTDNAQRWGFALEGSNQGLWDWNIETGEVIYSASWRKFLGYEENEIANSIAAWEELLHPDDNELMRQHRNQHFSSLTPAYETEFRMRAKDGSYRWILSRGMITERKQGGEPLRMIGIHTDITGRKLMEEKYKLLFYKSPLPMWTLDGETGRFLEVNDAALKHYGYSRQEFLLLASKEIQPEEGAFQPMHPAKEEESAVYEPSQTRHRKKSGEHIDVLVNGFAFSEGGKSISLVIVEDITEKLLAEEKLKRSERIYRLMFQNLPLPGIIYDSASLRILDANTRAQEHYGYTKKEMLRLSLLDLHPPGEYSLVKKFVEKSLHRPKTIISQWQHRKKDGTAILVEAWGSNIAYQEHQARLLVVNDVTAKAQAEADLQASNERYELATQATSDAIYDLNLGTGELKWSEGLRKLFGWREEDVRMHEWEMLVHPDDRQQTVESLQAFLNNPAENLWRCEYRFQNASGTFSYVMDRGLIVRSREGKPLRLIGAVQDITPLKLKEKELQESNKRFEYAAKATSDIIWDWDLTTNEILWSDQYEATFGWPLPPGKSLPLGDSLVHIHPEDVKRVQRNRNKAFKQPQQLIWEEEFRFQRSDGSYAHVIDRGLILRNESGTPKRLVGALQDISTQKFQKELQDLELRVFELSASPDLPFQDVLKTLLDGVEKMYAHACAAITLFLESGKPEVLAVQAADRAKAVLAFGNRLQQSLPGGQLNEQSFVVTALEAAEGSALSGVGTAPGAELRQAWTVPVSQQTGDDTLALFTMFLPAQPSPSEQEAVALNRIRNLLRILLINHQAAKQIRLTNERFDNVLKATHDLIWDWNLETGSFYRSLEGVRNVYGVQNERSIKTVHDWLSRVQKEDHAKVLKVIDDVLHATDQDTFDVEYRFLRDDGSTAYLYDRGIIIRNKAGKPIRMIGAAQDITQRKMLEQELLQQELERQRIISQATIDTQEQERTEIGKELHDNVNQILTTTKLYLDLSASSPELKDELIQKSSKNIIHVINEIRQLSRSLMDPSIGDLGLVDSINDLIENVNLTRQIKIHLSADTEVDDLLDERKKLMVFRIIQEAMSNILRHSQATSVKMKLKKEGVNILLSIQDNGVGFDPDKVQKGIGLKNIRNRVYLGNGDLVINAAPGKGSTLKIKFPINQNNSN